MWYLRKFFSLPPIVYLILAPLGAALAIYLFIDDRQQEADKAAALASKPPAIVKLEAFDATKHTGKANEVAVLAQMDANQIMDLTQSKRGSVRNHWTIAPLYATDAADTSQPAIGVMVERDPISDEQMSKMVVAAGKFGPILLLNGATVSRSSESKALGEVEGRTKIAPDATIINPFEAGRAVGLAPSDDGRNVALFVLVAALGIGGFGVFRFLAERNNDQFDVAEEAA